MFPSEAENDDCDISKPHSVPMTRHSICMQMALKGIFPWTAAALAILPSLGYNEFSSVLHTVNTVREEP